MMSLSIHMTTSQGRTCVPFVTNSLQGRLRWSITRKYTVYTQVNVWLMSTLQVRLKLIVTMSLSNNVMTIRGHLCVLCVTNDIRRKRIWMTTLEITCTNVLFVANDLQHQITLLCTAEFTVERNRTSVHCVARVSADPVTCNDINVVYTAREDHLTALTVESCLRQMSNWSVMFVFTLVQSRTHVDTVQTVLRGLNNSSYICWSYTMKERNHINVLFVANDFQPRVTFLCTAEFTVERNRTNVLFVTNDLQHQITLWCTAEFTLERNHSDVCCVTYLFTFPAACSHTNVMYTATEDHITVLTVGSCLRQIRTWSNMYVFILVQSRTHVDTVQTVLHGLYNSRHIYWSHTMKALGSRVTFVRWNSAAVLTLRDTFRRDTFSDMKLWNQFCLTFSDMKLWNQFCLQWMSFKRFCTARELRQTASGLTVTSLICIVTVRSELLNQWTVAYIGFCKG